MLKVLGDGGLGEGPSFKKGLPPKMHFHRNTKSAHMWYALFASVMLLATQQRRIVSTSVNPSVRSSLSIGRLSCPGLEHHFLTLLRKERQDRLFEERPGVTVVRFGHQSDPDGLAYIVDEMYGHALSYIVGKILQVRLVLPGHDHLTHAGSASCQNFFLHASHREHATPESQLAGHGHFAAHRNPREKRGQSHCDGHSRGWPVLGDSGRGNMHVNIGLRKKIFVNAVEVARVAQIRERCSCRFLHHFAERPGHGQFLFCP